MKKVTAIVIGAGDRGSNYADFEKLHPERFEVIGVAEPRKDYRDIFVEKHNIKKDYIFESWEDVAQKEKLADMVIISTQDRMHAEPIEALAKKGYHILLEKPMASTMGECKRIYNAVKDREQIFGVCHVLRYTPFTRKIKEIINSGAIGEVIGVQRTEPVGFWHHAHSFTRGNWRNTKESSFMLLAKSCHDIDWINYIIGKKCTKVSSFGSLKHLRKENKPERASDRCLNCGVESECPYSAKKIYLERFYKGETQWPVNVVTSDTTESGIIEALKNGPYGRCVYGCDNDVVDNQIVNMQFEDNSMASFVMIAFTGKDGEGRRTSIFGSKGEIRGDDSAIEVYDFVTGNVLKYDTTKSGHDTASGHGGGDYALMDSFVKAVSDNNKSLILSGAKETFESHQLVFAAEQSRLENKVILIP